MVCLGLKICNRIGDCSKLQLKRLFNDLKVETKTLNDSFEEHRLKSEIKDVPNEVLQNSLKVPDFFGVKKLVNMNEMFEARVYMGHKIGTLNDHMRPYIYGDRLDHLIIDLNQTEKLLHEALNFAAHIAFRSGIILFVNKSPAVSYCFCLLMDSYSLLFSIDRTFS